MTNIQPERREILVKKLVTTLHLSVPERQELPNHVSWKEVKRIIRIELSEADWHPRNWRPHATGAIVWEGWAIEALRSGSFRVHAQAGSPSDTTRLRHHCSFDFASADEAIEFYLEKEFSLGEIDGVALKR